MTPTIYQQYDLYDPKNVQNCAKKNTCAKRSQTSDTAMPSVNRLINALHD